MYPETMANDNPDLAERRFRPFIFRQFFALFRWPARPDPFTVSRLRPGAGICLACALLTCLNGQAQASDRLRLAVQKSGTFAWELAILHDEGLDKEAGLDLQITEIASPEAAKIALLGGSADVILTDWLWAARQRSLGGKLLFFPYSTALGAVMVPAASPIRDLAGLKGKSLAVAGGPLDKSWLLLRALALASGLDLAADAKPIYGAPALIYQKTLSGEVDAALNYWNFCVALESRGFRRLIDMANAERRLGAKGPVAMVGYVFGEEFARANASALARFFKIAARAKEILARSGAAWQKIAARTGIEGEKELALYRQTYIEGIPRRPVREEAADARALYRVLAKTGGPELVGNAEDLDEGIFYQPIETEP